MYFKIPYEVYQEKFKGGLYRLKWDKEMKMFESDEKEYDFPEEMLEYKVNFIVVDYELKHIAKELGAQFCGVRKQWYYVGNDVQKLIQFTKNFKHA